MKKIFTIIPLLLVVGMVLCGCGSIIVEKTDDEETQNDSIVGEIVESVKPASYEDILEEYSKKLREATPGLIEEYNEEAKSNQGGLQGLATLCNNKVSELAKISVEGTQEMAKLYYKQGSGKYEEYSEWAGKLQEVYMEEASKIQEAYMDSAM